MTRLPAASHSFHVAWGQCPRKAWHTFIARDLQRETTPEMAWGTKVHAALEAFIGRGEALPDGMAHYAEHYQFPRTGCKLAVEAQLAVNARREPCDFRAPEAYVRGVLDVIVYMDACPDQAMLIDHKTGKRREDPSELRIHALLLKAHAPYLREIKGWYMWLASPEVMGIVYDLSDTDVTWEQLHATQGKIANAYELGAEAFPPRQGPLCGWCPVTACEFHP